MILNENVFKISCNSKTFCNFHLKREKYWGNNKRKVAFLRQKTHRKISFVIKTEKHERSF